MGRFLESREDAAHIFDLGKEAFDDMPVFINMLIIGYVQLLIGPWRDDRGTTLRGDFCAESI